jgi:hypothetical protein
MVIALKRFSRVMLDLSATLPSGLSPELLINEALSQSKSVRYALIETNKTPEESSDRLSEPGGTEERKRNV